MGRSLRGRQDFLLCSIFLIGWNLIGCTFKSKIEPPNTLHLFAEEKIKGLDPIYADDRYSALQIGQVYETLVQYHYLKRPYVIIPNLVESMPDVSPDGLTYTFHLKKGILFQDDPCFQASHGKGRELIAGDVVFSFKRLADPRLASSGWWILDGKILGINEWREAAAALKTTDYAMPVEGLKAIDRYTLQFKLVRRSAQFMYFLAMPSTGIVPHEAVEYYDKELINHAVGTGPFQLLEYHPNSKIVWAKNPTYRKEFYPTEGNSEDHEAGLLEDSGKQLPLVDRVVFQVMAERQPRWLNFMSGKVDVTEIPKDNFALAITPAKQLSQELADKGIRLTKTPSFDVTHLAFNMSDPLLGKNKLLRQAISLAYDGDTFIQLFYNGRAISAQGPIPPGIPGYDSKFRNPLRQFNLTRAKDLLAKAGYPEGRGLPTLEYAALADSVDRQLAEYLQKMLAALGIQVNISSYSWPQMLEAVKNRRSQMWEYAWSADYPDAESFLQLFYSKNMAPGPNDSNYSNPEFDRLYEAALKLREGSERTALYQKMVLLVTEDCPWIFKAHRLNYTLSQPWLRNYKPNDFSRNYFKYYRVDHGMKK